MMALTVGSTGWEGSLSALRHHMVASPSTTLRRLKPRYTRPAANARVAGNICDLARPIASIILSSAWAYQGVRASHVSGPECVWETLMMVVSTPKRRRASSPTRVETKERRSAVTSARELEPDWMTRTLA